MAGGELEKCRGEPVGAHFGITVDAGDDASWFLRESVARGVDEVAADVHERAATGFHLVADVGRIDVEVAEETPNGAEFAAATMFEQFAEAQPLGSAANHKGFPNLDPGAGADGEERLGFCDSQA